MDKKFNARIQHKIDIQENWEKAINFIPLKGEWIFYDKDASNTNIRLKIGDGKTKVNDLPFISTAAANSPNGEAASPQIQSDYNQNDDSQVDYIKNRPFYTSPPDVSFNFNFYRSRESMTWDGNILPNHPSVSVPGFNAIYYKVSDDFITSADCLNGYMKYGLFMEDDDMPMEEMKEYDLLFPCSQEILTQFTLLENEDMFLNTFAISFKVSGSIPIEQMGISVDVPSSGTYFLYDTVGDLVAPGYVKALDGALKTDLTDPDLANDPDLLPAADIYGSGTLLLAKKVSSEFLPTDKILNATMGMNMVSWGMEDMDSSMSAKVMISENVLSNMVDVILGDDNTSYALLMEGTIPLFASISSPLATFDNGLQIPGPGTYFAYSNMGREYGGMELWVNFFETPETVFQIDPKYIPKQKVFVPDYDERDPESDSYIANKPYYSYSYYNHFNGVIDQSSSVLSNQDGTKFYQWGYDVNIKNPSVYNKGDSDITVLSVNYMDNSGTNTIASDQGLSCSGTNSRQVFYAYSSAWVNDTYTTTTYAYIVLEDNITTEVRDPYSTDWSYIEVTFPKKGIYYLYDQTDPTNISYTQQIDLRQQPNSSKLIPINTISSYENERTVSSAAIYKALGNSSGFNKKNDPESYNYNDLITPHGLWYGLNHINDYMATGNYATSSYSYPQFRGSYLFSSQTTPSYNGTISWIYQ